MEHKVILVEYGRPKSSNWMYDTIFYTFNNNKLNLTSDFFQKNLNISDLYLYPEIYICETNDTERIITFITRLQYFEKIIVNEVFFFKNTRKFSKITIVNEETKITKNLYLLKNKISEFTIFESFGESDEYQFVVPNQYFHDFISVLKTKGNLNVLDYIGVSDTAFINKCHIIKKLLINKLEKNYYLLHTELPDEIDMDELSVRPLDMTNDFDIESLIENGNIITKTLIDWYYTYNCKGGDHMYDELIFRSNSLATYSDNNIVIFKLDDNNYRCLLSINNKKSKLEIYERSEPRTYKKDNVEFYFFGDDVICFKDIGWMFFRLDAWRSISSNLHYFHSIIFDEESDDSNN